MVYQIQCLIFQTEKFACVCDQSGLSKGHLMLQAFSGDGWVTGITEAMTKCHRGFQVNILVCPNRVQCSKPLSNHSEGVRSFCKYMTESLVTVQLASGCTKTLHTEGSEDRGFLTHSCFERINTRQYERL